MVSNCGDWSVAGGRIVPDGCDFAVLKKPPNSNPDDKANKSRRVNLPCRAGWVISFPTLPEKNERNVHNKSCILPRGHILWHQLWGNTHCERRRTGKNNNVTITDTDNSSNRKNVKKPVKMTNGSIQNKRG